MLYKHRNEHCSAPVNGQRSYTESFKISIVLFTCFSLTLHYIIYGFVILIVTLLPPISTIIIIYFSAYGFLFWSVKIHVIHILYFQFIFSICNIYICNVKERCLTSVKFILALTRASRFISS